MRSAVPLALCLLLLLPSAAARAGPDLDLPPSLPAAERQRLRAVAAAAAVSTETAGEPFEARPAAFEYLLDHPEFATRITRAFRLARYRIWRDAEGLWLDDGWGAVGRFDLVHADRGRRIMYARGRYQPGWLPAIHGEAVVVIAYALGPAADGRSVVAATVTGFVALDSRLLTVLGKALGPVARAKAEREARTLVKVFAKTMRVVEADPAEVRKRLTDDPAVDRRELDAFLSLLGPR